MMLGKFKVVAATIVAVAASVLLVSPADAGKKATQGAKAVAPSANSIKLEPGAWVAKVVGVPAQWSYVISTDPSGRHAAGYGTIDVGFYSELDEMIDETSPLLIDIVMTGPATAKFNSIWYGIKNEPEVIVPDVIAVTGHIVYIGVNRGELRMIAPGKAEATHNICYFDPVASDSDLDGLPDPGATPFDCAPTVTTVDTRLGQ